ncbi:MAG TPA: GNAT family N-acetyltransferase [Bryobacteraceae bacterium]|nr:GNAT family N-acetyltransferase [Bryobacteraceae bacterium]
MFADLALARRLEAAEAAIGIACAHSQRGAPAAVEHVAGGYAVFVGVNSMLTHALGLGMNGPVTRAEVDRMEAFFRGRGAPVNIDLCPLAHPSLIEILRGRPYNISEFNTVLALPLTGAVPASPDGRIRECVPEDREIWSRTVAAGFFERHELSDDETAVADTIFGMPGSRCFLGCSSEGRPAAGAALAIREGLASFFGDSTVPAYRGAGLHSALIRERLSAAIRAGCDTATASTLPGSLSQRNYERLGFQVAYTKLVLTS